MGMTSDEPYDGAPGDSEPPAASENASASTPGGLSPDEADRLADRFRPVWEDVDDEDDAPPKAPSPNETSAAPPAVDGLPEPVGDAAGPQSPQPAASQAAAGPQPPQPPAAPASSPPQPPPAPETAAPVDADEEFFPGATRGVRSPRMWLLGGGVLVVAAAVAIGLIAQDGAGGTQQRAAAEPQPASEGPSTTGSNGAGTDPAGAAGNSSSDQSEPEASAESASEEDGATSNDEGPPGDEDQAESSKKEGHAGAPADDEAEEDGTRGETSDSRAPAADGKRGEQPGAPDPEPKTVKVQVRAVPRGAALLLDGERVSNPYVAEVERSDEPHRFVARARGYRAASRRITFDSDTQATLRLHRKRRRQRPDHDRRRRRRRSRSDESEDDDTAGFVKENPY